jgi:putative membrane protein
MWQFSPEIVAGILFAGWIYWRGRPRGSGGAAWRAIAFYAGLLALAAALLSPIEPLADHVFAIHQIEHMLLRSIGPMLILIGAPQGALMRGLPDWLRRPVAQPAVNSAGVRSLFGFFSKPPVATFLFLFATYFWMVPRWHDIAILNEPIHYLWHVSLLVSGLFFFSVLFDPRPAPAGPRLGTRLAMFFLAAMGNILLGAFLSFKTHQLYHAYDVMGRFWGISPLSDEQIGGLTMWIPGTMMFAASALYVLYRWGNEEGRTHERRERMGTAAIHAADARAGARRNNRMLAVGLGSFAAMVLAIAVAASILYEHELATDRMTLGVDQAETRAL